MDVADNLTEEQLAEMKEVFSLFDKNGDGVVGVSELGAILRSLGLNPSEEEINDLVDSYEETCSGRIDYLEIMTIVSKKRMEPPDTEESLREAFRAFDKDGSGFLSLGELQHIMTTHGEKLTEDEVKEMIEDASDGKGNVRYEDFARLILSK